MLKNSVSSNQDKTSYNVEFKRYADDAKTLITQITRTIITH